jgi:uncharacterized protein YjeT (DUF2065 family)
MNRWKVVAVGLVAVLIGLIYLGHPAMGQKQHKAHITIIGGRLVGGQSPNLGVPDGYDLPVGEVKGFSCIPVNVKDFNGTTVIGVPQCYVLTQ